jgi:Transposase IS116/IS110/IS902 family
MTSSSWPASRSPSPTPRRSKAWPRLPVRPTGSTPGCSPELSRRDLVPAIWLPTLGCGPSGSGPGSGCTFTATGPRSTTASTPPCWPSPSRVRSATCFGAGGRQLLARLTLPEPWIGNLTAALALIDDLDDQIDACEQQLRRQGADHPSVPLLMTAPGIAWVLGYPIAAEVDDSTRFPSPKKLCGSSGLCPRVYQSGRRDQRGPLAKNGPPSLRWALIEAAIHAARHPCYRDHYQHTKQRPGRQRGARVARVEVARKLTEPSGTCSPAPSPLLRQGPLPALWSPDDPCLNWASRSLPSTCSSHPGGHREMSTHRPHNHWFHP